MNTFLKTRKSLISVATASLFVSVSSFAADHTAEITAAATEGSANVTAVIGAIIGIAILGFGINALLSWFKNCGYFSSFF